MRASTSPEAMPTAKLHEWSHLYATFAADARAIGEEAQAKYYLTLLLHVQLVIHARLFQA